MEHVNFQNWQMVSIAIKLLTPFACLHEIDIESKQ